MCRKLNEIKENLNKWKNIPCLEIHYLLQGHEDLQHCFLLRVFIVLALGLLPFPYEF